MLSGWQWVRTYFCLKGLYILSPLLSCTDSPFHSPGLLIYFAYGVSHSVQRQRLKTQQANIETVSDKMDKDMLKEERF